MTIFKAPHIIYHQQFKATGPAETCTLSRLKVDSLEFAKAQGIYVTEEIQPSLTRCAWLLLLSCLSSPLQEHLI